MTVFNLQQEKYTFADMLTNACLVGGERNGESSKRQSGYPGDWSHGEWAPVHHLLRALHRGRTLCRVSIFLFLRTNVQWVQKYSVTATPAFSLVQAVTLGCAHSFCHYCIGQWRKRRDECPICRQLIQCHTRCLAFDNFIDSMVENLSSDMKARRRKLIAERKAERCVCRPVMLALTLSCLLLDLWDASHTCVCVCYWLTVTLRKHF